MPLTANGCISTRSQIGPWTTRRLARSRADLSSPRLHGTLALPKLSLPSEEDNLLDPHPLPHPPGDRQDKGGKQIPSQTNPSQQPEACWFIIIKKRRIPLQSSNMSRINHKRRLPSELLKSFITVEELKHVVSTFSMQHSFKTKTLS